MQYRTLPVSLHFYWRREQKPMDTFYLSFYMKQPHILRFLYISVWGNVITEIDNIQWYYVINKMLTKFPLKSMGSLLPGLLMLDTLLGPPSTWAAQVSGKSPKISPNPFRSHTLEQLLKIPPFSAQNTHVGPSIKCSQLWPLWSACNSLEKIFCFVI